jgi:predicted metal-dependent hydrolase
MSHKTQKIADLIATLRGKELDAHYLGYFECFNQEQFFEAHEVLEELWLPLRRGPEDRFYKGLIQFAGAFVHVQKRRLRPAAALLRLARGNLEGYPTPYRRLDVRGLVQTIDSCLAGLTDASVDSVSLSQYPFPKLALLPVST